MKSVVILIVLLCCSVSYGQCPGGTCKVKNKTVSVLKKTETTTKNVAKKVTKKVRHRLLRRR